MYFLNPTRTNGYWPIILLFILSFLLESNKPPASSALLPDPVGRMSDSLELVKLYNSLNGPIWLNVWDLNSPMDNWSGVAINSEGRIIALHLEGNRLFGELPEVLHLPFTTELNFSGNKINGPVPDLKGLPNLNYINLTNNDLSGPLPDFTSLPKLEKFLALDNEIEGPLPDLSNLPELRSLDLYFNRITGSIPDFSKMLFLENLDLRSNPLSGSIPDFSHLPNLKTLGIGGDEIIGLIPDFSKLPKLEYLAIQGVGVSGNVPDFSNLPNLEELVLTSSFMNGGIPDFSNLPALRVLDLSNNRLEGPVIDPTYLPALEVYNLHNNQLSGPLPDFENLPRLRELILGGNLLEDTIPNLSHLGSLEKLDLSSNSFNGTVPDFSKLPRLSDLNLRQNQLSGAIPDFSSLPRLRVLILNANQFDLIPRFTKVPLLEILEIQENNFTLEDVIRNIDQIQDYTYAPQSDIPYPCPFAKKTVGEDLSIQLYSDLHLSNSEYHWYKNGLAYLSVQGQNRLDINDLQAEDAGNYQCKITNPLAPDLELWTKSIELKIDEDFSAGTSILSAEPGMPGLSDPVSIYYDITSGNGALSDCNCDIYVHTGVLTSESSDFSDWKHVSTVWGVADPTWKMTPVEGQPNLYRFDITPSIREFYNIPPNEVVEALAFVFRNDVGSLAGKTADNIDIFYPLGSPPISAAPLNLRIGPVAGSFGEQVCAEVLAQTPTAIGKLDLSIRWDPGALSFDRIDAMNLADLDLSDFNLSTTADGTLSMIWESSTPASEVSFPEETSLFEICYTVQADDCINSMISFADSPQFINAGRANGGCLFIESSSGIFSANCEQALMIPAISDYQANAEYTDAEGWTNYLKLSDEATGVDTILLGIKKNERLIGTIGDGVLEVNVKKSPGSVEVTELIRQLPGMGDIEAAVILPYFWEVNPNHNALNPGDPVGLRFFFGEEDLKNLGNALGTSITHENLVFFKAPGALPAQGIPDLTGVISNNFQLFTLGNEPGLTQWAVADFGSGSFSATMNIESFSFGGILAVKGLPTDVKAISGLQALTISPNPSPGHVLLFLTVNQQEWLDLSVIDLNGQILYRDVLGVVPGSNRYSFHLEHLPGGMYFLQLHNRHGQFISRKFLINH